MTKIWRVWLKNWVCHALLNFKIKMGVAGSIFELHPPNFVKIHIFWISTNDSKTIFCWLCWYRIWKKDDPVLRPGVKESMCRPRYIVVLQFYKMFWWRFLLAWLPWHLSIWKHLFWNHWCMKNGWNHLENAVWVPLFGRPVFGSKVEV